MNDCKTSTKAWRLTIFTPLALSSMFVITPPLWAALAVPPAGLTATAMQTSANSVNWYTSGTDRYAWGAGEWLEYQLDFGAGGSWKFSLTATNHNSPASPGLPSGYSFNIAVLVDGVSKGSFGVPGSTTTYMTGTTATALSLSGIHTIRFTWTNDAWQQGVYDANVQVKQIAVSPIAGADTTAPTVSVIAPASGAIVGGSAVTVSASASDTVGVAGVQFKLDGAPVGTEDTTSPYGVTWDSTKASNGSHTLTATARDAAGNTATSAPVTVTVSNVPADTTPPTVSLTAPATGAGVGGSAVMVSASASDTVGVAGVQFKLDGAVLGAEDTTSPYSVTWNTTTASSGAHSLTATARDAAGNQATSSAVSVTVDNVPPTLTITSPADGQVIVAPTP